MNSHRRPAFRPGAEALEDRQLLNAGDLDTTFGATGPGYTLPGPLGANAVQIQSDGNILAAGTTTSTSNGLDFRQTRLTPSGTPDTSFGSGGSVTTDFAGRDDRANDLAVLGNGKILVVGDAGNVEARAGKGNKVTYYDNVDFGLVRYNSDGSLDTTFGPNHTGKVTTNISQYTTTDTNNKRDSAKAVAVQDDGKIVVGGLAWTGAGTADAVLVRYNADGSLDDGSANDTTPGDHFGSGGIVQIHLAGFRGSGVWDLAIQRGDPNNLTDDKIITFEDPSKLDASGNAHYGVAVARYNLDGSPDNSFGTGGRTITIDMVGYMDGWKMASQGDGSIVVAGDYSSQLVAPRDLMLVRFTPGGLLDTGFGNGGIVRYADAGLGTHESVAIQPGDDKIVVSGYVSSALVARFTSNGAIDTSFGNGGVATLGVSGSGSYDVALQTDGKVVAVGSAQNQFLAARFLGDPAPLQPSSAAPRGTTVPSPGQPDTLSPNPLMPLTDPDLTALVTDWLRAGRKRSRSSLVS
jgi:uncharacterized delta-60 repeat protein